MSFVKLRINVFLIGALVGVAGFNPTPAQSQEQKSENFRPAPVVWGGGNADIQSARRLRFYTDSDYPPFNYYDEDGQLTGFNIDMARAICQALKQVCLIEPKPWDELIPALTAGDADAVIASHAITKANRQKMQFSDPYYRMPARFVVRSDSTLAGFTPKALAGKRIGVVKNTAHEAYLRAFFADASIVTFKTDGSARSALRFGKIETLFGDGVNLMFWLNGASSRRCCVFRGGAYTESRFFSEGVGIAVAKGNDQLAALLSQGLNLVRKNGDYEELLLRYFPMSLY